MTLPSSGALSFSQIQGEFGGSNPISLSEYYRGGPIVPNHGHTSPIPTSGTISVNNFYGTSATAPVPSSRTFTHQRGGVTQGALIRGGYVQGLFGGISPNPVGQISSGPNYSINRLETELQGCAGFFRFWVARLCSVSGRVDFASETKPSGAMVRIYCLFYICNNVGTACFYF